MIKKLSWIPTLIFIACTPQPEQTVNTNEEIDIDSLTEKLEEKVTSFKKNETEDMFRNLLASSWSFMTKDKVCL